MKILLLSDLHLEFQDYQPHKGGYDVVVLAGDIHTKGRGVAWARDHFKVPVFYVPGNHEGYGGHWQRTIQKMQDAAAGSHVHILHHQALVHEGVRFIGTTGWSQFTLWPGRAQAMQEAGAGRDHYSPGAKDYRFIRTAGYRRITPADTARWATDAKNFLIDEVARPHDGPTIVVTHHAPSALSLREGRAVCALDATDANDWDDVVAQSGAAFWFHGHTHVAVDYMLGKTRVVSNPRGYPGQDVDHRLDGIWEV